MTTALPHGDAAVRERSRSRDRAQTTTELVPVEATISAEEPWYQVKGALHLGLGLRIGGIYKLSELQRRCNGTATKLKSLQDCTGDPGLLQKVAAPLTPEAYQLPLRRSSSDQEPRARSRRSTPLGLVNGQVVWHDRPGERTRLARMITAEGAADKPNDKTYTIKYLDRASSSAAGGADAAGGEDDGLVFNVAHKELRAMAVHEVSMVQTMLATVQQTSVPGGLASASSSCTAQPGAKAADGGVEGSGSAVGLPAVISAPEMKRTFLGYGNTQPASVPLPKPPAPPVTTDKASDAAPSSPVPKVNAPAPPDDTTDKAQTGQPAGPTTVSKVSTTDGNGAVNFKNTSSEVSRSVSLNTADASQHHFGRFVISPDQIFYTSKAGLSRAIVNLRPIVPGHVLVISSRTVARMEDLTVEEYSDLWTSVRDVQRTVESVYGSHGSNVAVQDGRSAGQSVPHVHVHILPRVSGDFERNDDVYNKLQDWAPSEIERVKVKLEVPDDSERRDRTLQQMAAEAATYREILQKNR